MTYESRIIFERDIVYDGVNVGKIFLNMMGNLKVPFLNYAIMPPYQKLGIASREVPLFLKECNAQGIYRICANVINDNIASVKILERNGFVKIKQFKKCDSYLIDLRISKEKLQAFMDGFKTTSKHFGINN